MKKFAVTVFYVLVYLGLMFAFSNLVSYLWFNGFVPKEFAYKNYIFVSLIGFLLTLAAYMLIFKLRKKDMIKTYNFSKLSGRNFIIALVLGTLMGVFTSCICNTSYIVNNMPKFEQYLNMQINGSSSFIVFLIIIAITFACEEMVFRGTIFNEIRSQVSLYPAVLLATAVYGVLNGFMMGVGIGLYASIAALFFTLSYVYMESLFAPIVLQIASIYAIAAFIKTGIWLKLRGLGDAVLVSIITAAVLVIISLYYFMYHEYKKAKAGKKAAAYL